MGKLLECSDSMIIIMKETKIKKYCYCCTPLIWIVVRNVIWRGMELWFIKQ